MSDAEEPLTGLPDTGNSRRSFLRKVLGVDTFRGTKTNTPLGSEENHAHPSKIVSIRIDAGRCTACGQCCRLCMPDAVSVSERENSFSLRFTAASCIDCGLCVQVCPEGALELDEMLSAEPGPAREPVEVAAGTLSSCASCHTPIAEIVDHTHCFVCRQRPATPAYLSVL